MLLFRDVTTNEITMGSIVVEASEYNDWYTTRHQLMDMFYRRAIASGVQVRLDTTIYDAHEDEDGVSVKTKDGVELRADLLIAADGIRSRLRPKILADIVEANGGKTDAIDPHITNVVSHSVTIPGDVMRQYPELKSFIYMDALSVWTGPNGWVVGRYDRKLESWWGSFATRTDHKDDENDDDNNTSLPSSSPSSSSSSSSAPTPLSQYIQQPTQTERLWSEHGNLPALINAYSHASPELKLILSLAQSCDRWLVAEMPPLPRWISPKSHMILLGDSAHAMRPNAAQGFSQTVEDIGVLDLVLSPPFSSSTSSTTLSSSSASASTAPATITASSSTSTITSSLTLSQKLKQWERIRKPRAEKVQEYARFNSNLQLHSSETKHLLPLSHVKPSSSPPARSSSTSMLKSESSSSESASTSPQSTNPNTNINLNPNNNSNNQNYNMNELVTSKIKTLRHTIPDSNARFHSSAFFKWIHGFDVIGEAKLILCSGEDGVDCEEQEGRKREESQERGERESSGDGSGGREFKGVLKAKI